MASVGLMIVILPLPWKSVGTATRPESGMLMPEGTQAFKASMEPMEGSVWPLLSEVSERSSLSTRLILVQIRVVQLMGPFSERRETLQQRPRLRTAVDDEPREIGGPKLLFVSNGPQDKRK